MAVAKVQTKNGFGNSATPAPALTSAPSTSNLMVLFLAWKSTATFTTPTGWNLIGTADYTPTFNEKMVAIYRVAQGGDTGSVTCTLSAASDYCYAMYEFSGADTVTPINQSAFQTQDLQNVSITSPAATANNCLPVAAFANTSGHVVSGLNTGWTQDNLETSSSVIYIESQEGPTVNSGSTSQATLTWGATAFTVEAIILIAPPASNVSLVQTRSSVQAAATSVTASLSSAPTAGNLMLVFLTWKSSATLSTPTGWTLVGTADYTPTYNLKMAVLWKKSAGSDGSVTLSLSASSDMAWAMYEYSGQDPTTPINGSNFGTVHAQNLTATSSIPSQLNCYPVAAFSNSATHTVSGLATGWTQDNLTTATLYIETQHGPLTTNTTTAVSPTLNWDNTYYSVWGVILIQPPTSASGTIVLSPTSIAVPYNGGSASFTATRSGYSGSITATTSDQSVANVVGGGNGSPQTFQVLRQITDGSGGTCTITITCADGVTNTLNVTVYGDLLINSTSNTFQPTGTISITENNYTGTVTCTLQNQVASAPSSPSLSQTAGGALGATTYYVKTTYVNSIGETLASTESSLAVSASNVLNVASPAAATNATGWNVYVSTSTNTETKQNASPIAIGTAWVEPTTGLIAGSALPTNNTTALCTVSPVSQSANSTTPVTYTFTPTNVAYGTMQVSFTDGNGVSTTQTIVVTGPLTVSTSTLSLTTASGGVTFTASEAADPQNLTASSSNTAIAAVDATVTLPGSSTFLVTPVAAGTCTITVSDTHGGTQTVSVTVMGGPGVTQANLVFVDPKSAAQTSTVSGGTAPYLVSSSAPSVATASISGSTVTVTPVAYGTCTVTVTDSSTPATATTIAVTVGIQLNLNPTTMKLSVGGTQTAAIANGRAAYTASTSNSAVATGSVSGSVLTVTAVGTGTCTITVTDADSETATVSVTVGAVTLSPTSMSFASKSAGNQTSTASGGTSPYIASSTNPSVATVTVSGGTVTVTPQGPGSTSVHVQDANNYLNTISVSVGTTTSSSYTLQFASPYAPAQQVTLAGGTSYTFTNSNTNIASFVLVGSVAVVKPISPGTCTVTILSSAGDQCVITITVSPISATIPTWTPLGQKQSVKFFDPANTSNSFSPQLNPSQGTIKPNSVRKYVETTNATAIISGGREYPPKEISLTWNQMDAADYESLRLFQYINPVVYVDNNDQGYLGVFVIDSIDQLPNITKKVYKVQASFLVIGPYNGQYTVLNQLTAPVLSAPSTPTTGGYIPGGTTLYFWSTVTSPFGESLVSPVLPVTVGSTTNTNYIQLSWTAPGSTWYRKTRLYWYSANTPASATFLADVLAGQTNSFNVYTNYIAYSAATAPTFGTAFTGYYAGGRWVSTT